MVVPYDAGASPTKNLSFHSLLLTSALASIFNCCAASAVDSTSRHYTSETVSRTCSGLYVSLRYVASRHFMLTAKLHA